MRCDWVWVIEVYCAVRLGPRKLIAVLKHKQAGIFLPEGFNQCLLFSSLCVCVLHAASFHVSAAKVAKLSASSSLRHHLPDRFVQLCALPSLIVGVRRDSVIPQNRRKKHRAAAPQG